MSENKAPLTETPLHRIEHYTLAILSAMASGQGPTLTDADIDFAIDTAERLAQKLEGRGHVRRSD